MNNDLSKIKTSQYNMIVKKKDGLAAYNTRTGRLIRSFGERAQEVEKILNSQKCIDLDMSNEIVMKLSKHGFLIENEYNELKEMENIENKAIFDNYLRLIILPTEYCNFRCVYCYEHFKRGEMSIAVQESLIESVEKKLEKFDGLIISWFGGEPLEAIDVIERLSKSFISICKKQKKAYNAGITTNGYNLTVETVRRLKKLHITEYQITIDGTPEVHDKQRVLINGTKTAEKILDNLKKIKENIRSSAFTIVLRTNFSKEMMSYLDEFREILEKNFSNDSRFLFFWQMISDYGYLNDDSVRDIFGSKRDYFKLMNYFMEYFDNNYMTHLLRPHGSVCYAMKRNSFVVSSDGVIKKCTCDMESSKNRFGKIGEGFDEKRHEKWLERPITTESKCYSCIKRPLCHNKACYKAKTCLPHLQYLKNILDIMSEKKKNYIEI